MLLRKMLRNAKSELMSTSFSFHEKRKVQGKNNLQ